MRITLVEYARQHGKTRNAVYKLGLRGRLATFARSGGRYTIDSDEPYPTDLRFKNGHVPTPRQRVGATHNHLCHDCGTILWEVTNCPETEDHRVRGRCDDCFVKHFRDP